VVTPEAEPLEPQLIKFEKKVEAGAEFFQTQAVYDPEKFAEFMDLVKPYNVPILAGIIPLRSAGMARFMNRNVPGIRVPEGLIEELDGVKGEERVKKSIEIAARLINQIKDLCQGVHIMAIGWEEIVPHILEASGLNRS
jgi:5,10-methylenetetrahydrofolate reductase